MKFKVELEVEITEETFRILVNDFVTPVTGDVLLNYAKSELKFCGESFDGIEVKEILDKEVSVAKHLQLVRKEIVHLRDTQAEVQCTNRHDICGDFDLTLDTLEVLIGRFL